MTEQLAHPVGHCFKTVGVTLVSLNHPAETVHLSKVDPVQESQPVGQAVIAAVSKKNLVAAIKQSEKAPPKHKTQFATQGEIVPITVLELKVTVDGKYLPHKLIGEQSNKVAPEVQVHLTVS